ncbi:MAG: prepilin-type N-terminal cleavage/methylation domain-containing protein [Candidatus Paceibacterota bacterium]
MSYYFYSGVSRSSEGFTLVEAVISIGIIAVIASVVLFDHGEITETTTTRGIIERIDVHLREAQVKATGSMGHNGDYSVGVGLYFVNESDRYVYFADDDGSDNIHVIANNFVYDGGDTEISTENIGGGSEFSLCAGTGPGSCGSVNELNIVYLRPEPGPRITDDAGDSYEYAEVTVEGSRTDAYKTLRVYSTGRTDIE